ncbi:hypothetical protein G7046_g8241 [Stylonectria norvegica]|nr:hypothetical protein G7046_g8241 [Stylonectria norvegica]
MQGAAPKRQFSTTKPPTYLAPKTEDLAVTTRLYYSYKALQYQNLEDLLMREPLHQTARASESAAQPNPLDVIMAPAPPTSELQWPPRSPHEALVSTPGGRKRYRQMLDRTSPSPSPRKRSNPPAVNLMEEMDNDEDEEDEETLQLKLQEIQARLKLKKLQKARTKKIAEEQGGDSFGGSGPATISGQIRNRSARGTTPNRDENMRPISREQIQVPASPVRKLQTTQPQTSPSRVLLGIDKGLRAKDVSLKRAPSLKKTQSDSGAAQTGGYLRSSRAHDSTAGSSEPSRPMTFNERLASVRTDEVTRAERQQKIQKLRSNAFNIGEDEMEGYKKNAVEISDEPLRAPVFSREEILSQKPTSKGLPRSSTMPSLRTVSEEDIAAPNSTARKRPVPGGVPEGEASSFEPYSSFHLSKRILPHGVLARHVSGKKVFTVKDLLRDVKAPDFALPDIEQDIVIFAILAKKSEPRAHKPAAEKNGLKGEDRGKYMVMTMVDLEFELDLFLFNTGFTQFWKLTEGTVVAILNPGIMPPPPGRTDTGKFSLVINSDEDTIIEIGSARDLGSCQSVKKDGELCAAWVNKKRTQFCEFHSNEAVRKQKASRLEVNGSGFGGRKSNSREVYGYEKKQKANNYDWETKSHWFSSRSMSAADLIDGKDRTPVDRKEKAEFLKRGLEAKERERDMMKKLGQIGNAAGKEYMRHTASAADSSISSSQSIQDEAPKKDARSLGLLGRDAAIHLSPVKRKRADSSQAGSVASSGQRSAFGWGSSLKDKLAKMKEGEKLRKDEAPPVRKKTRFVTDKGIREAGRESLGNDLAERLVTLEDDDDDELIIVK